MRYIVSEENTKTVFVLEEKIVEYKTSFHIFSFPYGDINNDIDYHPQHDENPKRHDAPIKLLIEILTQTTISVFYLLFESRTQGCSYVF